MYSEIMLRAGVSAARKINSTVGTTNCLKCSLSYELMFVQVYICICISFDILSHSIIV